MAKLLSKTIGKTSIRGELIPQYVQTSSEAFNKALAGLGVATSKTIKFDGSIKVGNDPLEINKMKCYQTTNGLKQLNSIKYKNGKDEDVAAANEKENNFDEKNEVAATSDSKDT